MADEKVPYVLPEENALKARELIREYGKRMLPVINNVSERKVVGVITRLNLLNVTSTKTNLLVRDIMERDFAKLNHSLDVVTALEYLLKNDEWYGVVVDDINRIKGIIGLENFIQFFYKKFADKLTNSIKEVYTKDVIHLYEQDELSKAWYLMLKHKFAGFPVVKADMRIVGSLTQYDLIKKGYTRLQLESQSGPRKIFVKDAMKFPPIYIYEDATMKDAIELMLNKDIGRIFVADNQKKIRGIIDRQDVISFLIKL